MSNKSKEGHFRIESETPTPETNFMRLLEQRQISANSLLCVGLDSDLNNPKMPSAFKSMAIDKEGVRIALQEFNATIIRSSQDLVSAYKPNIAFYEEHGNPGLDALKWTIDYLKQHHPDVPVILDAKRTDIGNTNLPYAKMAFDYFNADAITVNPYFGGEAIEPFLERTDKGIIVLCRTSNPGAKEFQDLIVRHEQLGEVPLYQAVAYRAAQEWNKNGNVCLVVGATYAEELAQVRDIVGEMPILVPGLGAQGGKPEDLPRGFNSKKRGIIANNSRAVIFAQQQGEENFGQAVRRETMKWRDAINAYR